MSSVATEADGHPTHPDDMSGEDGSANLVPSEELECPEAADTRKEVSDIMSAHISTFGEPKNWNISWVHDDGKSGHIEHGRRGGHFKIKEDGTLVVAMTEDRDGQMGTHTEKSAGRGKPLQIYETFCDGTSTVVNRNPEAHKDKQWSRCPATESVEV